MKLFYSVIEGNFWIYFESTKMIFMELLFSFIITVFISCSFYDMRWPLL